MSRLPEWLQVADAPDVRGLGISLRLHAGERAALQLVLYRSADLILVDDRAGAEEAMRLGLNVTGTLGILSLADQHDLLPTANR